MRLISLLVASLVITGCQGLGGPSAGPSPAARTVAEADSVRLERLTKAAREAYLDLFPVDETMGTGPGPRQDKLELYFTSEHRERQRRYWLWVLAELRGIPLSNLSPTERLTHRLLWRENELALAGLGLPLHQHYTLIQLDGGVPFDLIKLVGRQPLRDEADYRAWFRRLGRYPAFFDGVAQLLKDGIASGVTLPRPVVERSLAQIDAIAPADEALAKSPLWKPMTQLPAGIDAPTRVLLEAEYRKLLVGEVLPAARRLSRFVRADYLPQARRAAGIDAIPQGAAIYRYLIRLSATVDTPPDEIHQLGLAEMKRIQGLLAPALARIGYAGSIKDYRSWIQQKPEYFPFATGQGVLDHLYGIHARIVPQLPRLFGRMPKARFEIRLTDPAIAASAPAQWYPPSDDGSRPGIFAIPVVDPKLRSTIGLASLLAHEGVPGHHFDGSIMREVGLPEFRRQMWVNAFGEGWALYAESLGHEMGLYDDPAALVGRYLDELYRAGRLVVDTGLHAKGWTREQAVRYMVEECAFGAVSAEREVDRYMAWPAQALGYKLGELAILDIRRQAEQRLGPRFDIRKFHDALLEEGHLPLDFLRQRMDAWIESGGGA